VQTKLTLRLDRELIERAKAYACRKGRQRVAGTASLADAAGVVRSCRRHSPGVDGCTDPRLRRLRGRRAA